MEFIGRHEELDAFRRTDKLSDRHSQMTVVTGRRRIGKTRLIQESLRERTYLYLFVSRKDEALLCTEFVEQTRRTLGRAPVGTLTRFAQLFEWLCELAVQQQLTVVIDEFQEFARINESVYSDMQRLWDLFKERMSMHLVLSGSVQSTMRRIFDNYHEPLFGRATARFRLRPFDPVLVKDILYEYNPAATAEDLITFYAITGGVPKYIEQFVTTGALNQADIFTSVFHGNSLFLNEGRFVLLEEFGREHASYFSILALIAAGKNSRGDQVSILQKEVGGYLKRLHTDYSVIEPMRPLFSKPQTKNVRYEITDHFLRFWFRFIFKHQSIIEANNFTSLRAIVGRDFPTFAGTTLEHYFREKLRASGNYTTVGNYWERGNKNEIDVVAYNELTKQALIGEVKLQPRKISLDKLRSKAGRIQKELPGYAIEYRGFSLEDM